MKSTSTPGNNADSKWYIYSCSKLQQHQHSSTIAKPYKTGGYIMKRIKLDPVSKSGNTALVASRASPTTGTTDHRNPPITSTTKAQPCRVEQSQRNESGDMERMKRNLQRIAIKNLIN